MATKKTNPKAKVPVTPFDDVTTVSSDSGEPKPVELDITNPKHANLTYDELQALGKDK